jgi:hypothetical protein
MIEIIWSAFTLFIYGFMTALEWPALMKWPFLVMVAGLLGYAMFGEYWEDR